MLIIIMSGCSNKSTEYKPSIELINSTVNIVSDNPEQQPNVDGKVMENIGFVSLQYNFKLINNGKQNFKVSQFAQASDSDIDTIALTIEPSPELKAFAFEMTGVNLFSEKNHGGGFLSSPTVLEPNEEGNYSIEYILGSMEEIPEMTLAPNIEQLDELMGKAMNANLVIYYKNEEIKSFKVND
jgi:hypothetical protein